MTNASIIEQNRQTALAFLAGTHSPNIEDVHVIDATVAETIRCHGFPGGDFSDRESYKEFFRVFRRSFTDMQFTIHALVADETHVSARWEIRAKHTGDFAGVKADGRVVTFDGMVLYRMDKGRIAETWLHINELGLLSQIGAIPAMAA
jgi:steroid delta-isomerase-like uncharacterized protein